MQYGINAYKCCMSHSKHPKTIRISKSAKARIKAGVALLGAETNPYTISGLRKDLFNVVNKAVDSDKTVHAKTREGAHVVVMSQLAYTALLEAKKR